MAKRHHKSKKSKKATSNNKMPEIKKARTKSISLTIVCTLVVALSILMFFLFQTQFGNTFEALRREVLSRISTKPDIVLITVDTLRADHLSCYGYSKNTSPNIDKFAEDALLFENCLSHAPATGSSVASLMSGFLPHETRVFESNPLPAGIETLAEILKNHSYKTLAVVSNYMLRKKRGYEQGFMVYDDTMNDHELVRKWPERIAERTTDRAIELLNLYHMDQMFIWIHYQDPHGPYTPPPALTKQFHDRNQPNLNLKLNTTSTGFGGIPSYQIQDNNRDFFYYQSHYDGEIRYMDKHFMRLIDKLKDLGLYEKALIIFSADHGEGMGEHDYFFAHGENLYNHQTHVPLIIKYGKKTKGRRSDYVQHIDIVPTVMQLLNINKDFHFRGRNLLTNPEAESEIVSAMHSPLNDDGYKFSLVMDGLKFIYTPQIKQYELYDLTKDLHETNNLSKDSGYGKQLGSLMASYNNIVTEDRLKLPVKRRPNKLTEEEIEKMKSLGYVQ